MDLVGSENPKFGGTRFNQRQKMPGAQCVSGLAMEATFLGKLRLLEIDWTIARRVAVIEPIGRCCDYHPCLRLGTNESSGWKRD